jgi:uncharacterized membrane protein HdeD (DUF308 family)
MSRRDWDILGIAIILVIVAYYFISLLFWIGLGVLLTGIIWLIVSAKSTHTPHRWWISLILIVVGILIMMR